MYSEFCDCVDEKCQGNTVKKNNKNNFERDLYASSPQPHELVSAWLVLHSKGLRKNIIESGGEPLLIARMIIGCSFQKTNSLAEQFFNCVIGLLNGHEIDADRIDYTLRDGWVSDRRPISLDKLIATIHINRFDNRLEICYKKTVLPEIECLVDAKNHSFFWVINHHKVLYDAYLLEKAVERLALLLTSKKETTKPAVLPNDKTILHNHLSAQEAYQEEKETSKGKDRFETEALFLLFDYHSLIEPIQFSFELGEKQCSEDVYLLTDGDIIYLLKKYFIVNRNLDVNPLNASMDGLNFAKEWLTRDHTLKSVWKNRPEYNAKILEMVVKHKLAYTGSDISNRVNDVIDRIISILSGSTLQDLSIYLTKNSAFKELIRNIVRDSLSSGTTIDYDDIAIRVVNKITDGEGFRVRRETHKVLTPEKDMKIQVKEIDYEKIYVKLDGDNGEVVKLSDLDLPRKNIARNYNLHHIYLPKIYTDNACKEEIAHQEYEKLHKQLIIKEVENKIKQDVQDMVVQKTMK